MENTISRKVVFNSTALPSLSLAMIVKNESEHLKKLLPIVRGMVDEIIIVDTGSTDDTKQIAESFGANIYDFPWNDNFSDARNESLKYCTKDYIFWLDADDYIERQDIAKLKWFIQDNLGKAIFLNLVDKRYDRSFQSVQLRVFPNHKDLQFIGKVHEQISFAVEKQDIKYATCDVNIIHFGYTSPEAITEKLERNLRILLADWQTNKDDFLTTINTAKSYIGLGAMLEAETFVDHALTLIRENRTKVSVENEFIAVLTKLNLLTNFNRHHEILPLMEEMKLRYDKLNMFKLTYGEILFKFKQYEPAYKYLLPLKTGTLNLGLIPVDAQTLMKNLTILLLATSLNIGDFATAETCIRMVVNDPAFTIKRRELSE